MLVIAITQSGETADTLVSMRMAKKVGFPVLAIPNVVGSTAAREADGVLYTHAGPEIGVAATKTMAAQMTALYLFALYLAQIRNRITSDREKKFVDELKRLPELVEETLKREDRIKELAEKYAGYNNFLFLEGLTAFRLPTKGLSSSRKLPTFTQKDTLPAK